MQIETRLCALKHRFPSKRRRAKWRASWQFQRMVEQLRPGDIAIDCGASDGRCTASLAATDATVYSFEPDPHGYAALQTMFDGRANVHLLKQAVGVGASRTRLYRAGNFADDPDRHVQASTVYASKTDIDPTNAIEVEQIDLAAFVAALPGRVALLKMDIEGAEVPILEKLLDTGLIARIECTFAETHERIIPELASRTLALRRRIACEGLQNINLDWI